MFKKIISVLASAVMLLTVFDISAAVFAEPAETKTGSCGDNVTFTLTDTNGDGHYDKLVISGSGDMTDYNDNSSNSRPYLAEKHNASNTVYGNDIITDIIVEEGVTSVGDYAFYFFENVERVNLPSTLKDIGNRSFAGNTKLKNVQLPENLETIGEYVFAYCDVLETVKIPNGVKTIAAGAFSLNYKLKSVELPRGIETIGNYAFSNCELLASIDFPDTLTSIGGHAFERCISLTALDIPNSVTSIGAYAFDQCRSLSYVKLPDNLTVLPSGAFRQCTSLETVSLPASIIQVGGAPGSITTGPFDGSAIKILILPSSVTAITNNPWSYVGGGNLETVIYPEHLDIRTQDSQKFTHIKYAETDDGIEITEIILPSGKTEVSFPMEVNSKPVITVGEEYRQYVSQTGHTHVNESEANCTQKAVCKLCGEYGDFGAHTGGSATCTEKAVCDICGAEYGETNPDDHNFEDGACTRCGAADPNYSQPTETEPTTAEPTDTTTADTEPTETSPASTAPTGTSPSIPSRPSYPSSPVTTAAETTVTTVTTTTTIAEEIIYDEQPDEDVSVGALAYADNSDIPEKSKGLIAFAAAVLVAAVLTIKKRFF